MKNFIKISDKTKGAILVNINSIAGILKNKNNQCIISLSVSIDDSRELISNDSFETIQKSLEQYCIPVVD